MRDSIQKFASHRGYSKLYSWSKLIFITGSAQMLVQITGLLSGILIIRLLSTQDYAYYTIVNTMLGTMTLLADGGISTGVMAQGSKVWLDRSQLGTVLNTGLTLRKKFATASLAIAVPILFFLLLRQGASMFIIASSVFALIPSFIAALSDSLLEIVPKLHQDITSLQKNQTVVAFLRLFINGVSLFFFPFTFIAILANGLPRLYGNIKLRQIVSKYVSIDQPIDTKIQTEILQIVKRGLPELIYYCFSGQITIWLLSIFGNTTTIAESGVISRIGIVLNIISIIYATLVIPRFARLQNKKEMLLAKFFQILLISIVVLSISAICIYLCSSSILHLFGKNYLNLGSELTLYTISGCINVLISICFGLYSCKGWIIRAYISIPFNIFILIIGIYSFSLTTLISVIQFNIFVAICQLLLHFCFALNKIMQAS